MASPTAIAGDDIEVDFGDLPATVALSGDVDDPDEFSAIAWRWTLLEAPPGSSAALSSETVQEPDLEGVDLDGTYLLFLEVETANGWSEANPNAAPSSARVHVRVKSERLGLDKPASGERAVAPRTNAWVDALEDLAEDVETLAEELADATGPATQSALGVIMIDEEPEDPDNPVAINRDRRPIMCHWRGEVAADDVLLFIAPRDSRVTYTHVAVTFLDGGAAAAEYRFGVYEMTEAQWIAQDYAGATVYGELTVTQGGTGGLPMRGLLEFDPVPSAAASTSIIVVKCTSSPAGGSRGSDASVIVEGWRSAG